MATVKKGLYGKCFQTEVSYVKIYNSEVYNRCIDARKQLRNLLEQQLETNQAYGIYIQAKKENIGEWSSNKIIQQHIIAIVEEGEKFDKMINKLFQAYFTEWDQIKTSIQKLIRYLGELTEQTIKSSRPADQILIDLEKHKKDISSIQDDINVFMEKYKKHIDTLCRNYATPTNEKYKYMKKADKEIFTARSNDNWWRLKYGNEVLVSPQNDNRWLLDALTSNVVDKLKANKK